ncbi:MAG: helix-turn-helix transcriptional regulator [Brachybacterium sp.]|uniref:helix-turn-helix transcriptional regulator n=1 Tax=Brachybacterium sp. TaxID=1891286 RepID=UPI002649ABC4|nr:AraC family transcriptional regulator [Brachybacterium sp.]MDN5685208.1 helix-turn-helix transcriptional regulator [Brachybacterium sp.]
MQTLFDTGQFAPSDRIEAFQDMMWSASGLLHRIRFLPDESTSPHARMSGSRLDDDVLYLREVSTGIAHERTTRHLGRAGPEQVALVLPDGGPGHYEHDGFERPLLRGDLYATDLTATYGYRRQGAGVAHIVQIERSRLELSVETIRRADRQLVSSPLYGIVRDHLVSLSSRASLLVSPEDRAVAAEAIATLLRGLLASASRDDPQNHPAAQDFLLDRILLYVRLHATDPALSAAEIAAVHAVSERKLFQVWQSQPHSLRETVMHLRLEAARQRLIAHPHLTIAAVARASGFSDASHFSRRFRSSTACTPTEWRIQHGVAPAGADAS